jgi:outer membrane protein assembly factor BamE (lipoprotein component of BamABCDE complex)
MKRTALAFVAIALVCFSLAGCSTLKPFSQEQLDQISGFPGTVQAE